MINYPKTLVLIACLILSLTKVIQAQTTDKIKYYILYDRSGSVAGIDGNHNLKNLMEALIKKTEKGIKTAAAIEIYPFGTAQVLNKADFVNLNTNKKGVDNLLQASIKINNFTDGNNNKDQNYTNIHVALEKVRSEMIVDANSKNTSFSSAVFIFTDGKLDTGDYVYKPAKTLNKDKVQDDYYTHINELMDQIRLLSNRPVFLVQTSYRPENVYYAGLNSLSVKQKLNPDTTKLINDSTVFWIKNTTKFKLEGKDRYTTAFNDFVERANDMIIQSAPKKSITTDNNVDKAIIVQNIASYQNAIGTDAKLTEIIAKLPNLREMLSKLEINTILDTNDVKFIKKFIDTVSINHLLSVDDKARKTITELSIRKNNMLSALNTLTLSDKAFTGVVPINTSAVTDNSSARSLEQNIILGISDYIVDRAKQEAVYAFMENVKAKVFDKNPDIQKLFPEVNDKAADPKNFYDLSLLKDAFKADINSLPNHIMRNKNIYKRSEELSALVMFLKLFKNIGEQGNLEYAFKELNIDIKTLDIKNKHVYDASIFMTNVIGYLTTNDISEIYKNPKEFEKLSKILIALSIDTTTLKKVSSIDVNKSSLILGDIYKQYLIIKDQITRFNAVKEPTADFSEFRKMQADKALEILNLSSDLMINGFKILDILNYNDLPAKKFDYEKLQDNVKKCITAYYLLQDKDYTQATMLLAPFVANALFNVSYVEMTAQVDLLKEQAQNAANKYKEIKQQLIAAAEKLKTAMETERKTLIDQIKKYEQQLANLSENIKFIPASFTGYEEFIAQKSLFMQVMYAAGEVSKAQSAEDIKKIIAKYALPVASYRIKSQSSSTVMINSYLGLGANVFKGGSVKPMISAPIGIETSLGIGKKYISSLSLFISILDVGNIVSARLWKSEDELNKDAVRFENIVSPGAFLIYAPFKKLPLTLNTGYSFNPNRFSLSLNFDLPLFPIYRSK